MKKTPLLWALLLLGGTAIAQESTSFRLTEHVFNTGGHPAQGVILTSARFRLTLDTLGGSVFAAPLASSSFMLDGSFAAAYPPPGEVEGLEFTDETTLIWHAEKSVGTYCLYSKGIKRPFDPAYGVCSLGDIFGEATSVTDIPADGEALFFLVTARNRLREEGTKGYDSDGGKRPNPLPCP